VPLAPTIINLCRTYRAAAGTLLAALKLHPGQETILMQLWREDGQPLKTLAQRSGIQAPTATKMLQRLEASGIIERRASSSDGRSVNAFLTQYGRDLEPQVHAVLGQLETRITTHLSAAEFETLQTLLERVLGNLHGHGDAPCD
jgi:MarR family transcriptional regulator, organic hydroperoxide resistance regulator